MRTSKKQEERSNKEKKFESTGRERIMHRSRGCHEYLV